MPDLIIKPTNTSGNKVIIQDQGAVTRLQTDDAGITITAPTIASMANCTFPAGHCIQMVNEQANNPSPTISTTSDSFQDSGINIEITPQYNNSKILLMFQSGAAANASTAENHITIYRGTTNLDLSATSGSPSAYGMANVTTSMRPVSLLWVDTPGTSGSAIEYSIYYRSGSSGTAAYLVWSGSSWSFIAMEIKV